MLLELKSGQHPKTVIKKGSHRDHEMPRASGAGRSHWRTIDFHVTRGWAMVHRHPRRAQPQRKVRMRQAIATLAIAICCVQAVSGCDNATVSAETATPTMIPRPLVERELSGLLLAPEQVDAAMGAAAMSVTHDQNSMSDNSTTVAPAECLAIDGAAEVTVYADSGSWAERDQSLNDGDEFAHYLKEAVVLFPTVEKASAFVDASAQRWSACHQYTHLQSGTNWSAGQISNANGALSTTTTEQDAAAPGWGCGRALVPRNNVVVDVNTCSADRGDSALTVANQIAANVAARW